MTFTFDEKEHAYFLDGKPLMGITSVLRIIAKPNLIQWAANMAVDYISSLWMPGKSYEELEITSVLQEARTAHARKRDKAADAGTNVHAWIAEWSKDNTIALPEDLVAKEQAKQFVE